MIQVDSNAKRKGEMNFKLSDLTILGKLLLLPMIGIVGVAMYYATPIQKQLLPQDDFGKFGVVTTLLLGIVLGVVFFAVSAFVAKLCGVRVFRGPPAPDGRPKWFVVATEAGTERDASRVFHAADAEQAREMAEMNGLVVTEVKPQ